MRPIKDVQWINKDTGKEVVKTAGKAIGITCALVLFGVTLGAVNTAFAN